MPKKTLFKIYIGQLPQLRSQHFDKLRDMWDREFALMGFSDDEFLWETLTCFGCSAPLFQFPPVALTRSNFYEKLNDEDASFHSKLSRSPTFANSNFVRVDYIHLKTDHAVDLLKIVNGLFVMV